MCWHWYFPCSSLCSLDPHCGQAAAALCNEPPGGTPPPPPPPKGKVLNLPLFPPKVQPHPAPSHQSTVTCSPHFFLPIFHGCVCIISSYHSSLCNHSASSSGGCTTPLDLIPVGLLARSLSPPPTTSGSPQPSSRGLHSLPLNPDSGQTVPAGASCYRDHNLFLESLF